MEKALKLLKILRDDYIHGELDKDINEAINELEEAMKPKTCEGCKYVSQGRYRVPCDTCARTLHDEYEPKDNA